MSRWMSSLPGRLATNSDILWFVDNEAATSTLIRGSSREEDVCNIAELTHLLWAHHGCRVWLEWIDSDSNPSDGLSRDGVSDPWCKSYGIVPSVAEPPAWSCARALLESILSVAPGGFRAPVVSCL